jgi:hypothetical protein
VHLATHPPGVVESPAARLLGSVHPLERRTSFHVAAVAVGAMLSGSVLLAAREGDSAIAVALVAGVVEAPTCSV